MTWRGAFKATDAQGTHSSPPPTPVANANLLANVLAGSLVLGSPPVSFLLPPAGPPPRGPQQPGCSPHHIADILFTSFCPHCPIPSIWHPSLCANCCGKGQEFAKGMLAERVQFSPFYLKSPVSLVSI